MTTLELINKVVRPVKEKTNKEVVITDRGNEQYCVEFKDSMGLIERLYSFELDFEARLTSMVGRVLDLV